ncbi:NAD(P)-dependent oxidoreductase [Vibrio sp. 2-2(8)]|uniref:NAD(P)-dependent oxidoreductase n=1 Tax=Vibrio sp. 2-2(8) TaxID=2591014 RepID=UPI0014821226|nr:NAD(P)-dependent oxidoreductase [Vibrio sp. 2-2(8)]NNN48625.1 NAD(P)-dependent oxidoreductase [Vibrio sp. 2-2(8)]
MIIGNGLLSRAFCSFEHDNDVVIFASGTSNSNENNDANFYREESLLLEIIRSNRDKTFVYFSTCSIEDISKKESKYVQHKLRMESLINGQCKSFYIFRLPQVVGVTRSKTLISYLFSSIGSGERFSVQRNATRNLIDVKDVFLICNYIISNHIYINEVTNIASRQNLEVISIVNMIESILSRKANFEFIDSGSTNYIDISKIEKIPDFDALNDSEYVKRILLSFYQINEKLQ